MKRYRTVWEMFCTLFVVTVLLISLFGGFNLNSLVILMFGITIFAALRDLKTLWQLKQRKPRRLESFGRHGDL